MTSTTAFTPTTIGKGMSKLSRKNQVTIPVKVLREAGLEAGDALIVRSVGPGRVEIRRRRDVIDEFAGSLSYPPGYLDELRDEWDR
jgi:AbrB family looped-hinge helix DNA binding protein